MVMGNYRKAPKQEKDYPKIVMPEEKDKIIGELIKYDKNGFGFGYKDVHGLKISKVQFERVMVEIENMGMIRIVGYKDGGKIYPNASIDTFYRYGGFKMQDQILSNDLERLKLELESLKKTVEPPVSDKIKVIAEIAASITSALASVFGRV